jgi:uracil-DNA glycosylase
MNDPQSAPTQLQSADPADWPVAPGWQPLVQEFFAGAAGRKLQGFLQARLDAGATIFPPQPLRALELTPPEDVRVVILGQDPYHGRGQAEGLAFSVAPGVALPPSLRNIFKELQRDLGTPPPAFPQPGGSLVHGLRNGVLLLNTTLTVEEGQPASHAGKGWEVLTDAVIRHVAARHRARWCSCCGARTRKASARDPRRPGAPGAVRQPPVAAVGAAPAGALHRLRAFWAGAGVSGVASGLNALHVRSGQPAGHSGNRCFRSAADMVSARSMLRTMGMNSPGSVKRIRVVTVVL